MTTTPSGLAPDVEADLRKRVESLSLEQKVRVLTGADFWSLHPEPAAGLRRLVVSDGPAGVRGELWDERDPSANVPSPTALAATWDEALVERLGRLLAGEARRKGVDVILAPTVNLHRTPYGGRHFECFSEDPRLTARIGAAYVRGVQAEGVGATVKHFVANDTETERFHYDARVDERVLRELYLEPFDVIVREARVWAVMAAYNGVNGATMTEHGMLREVLQREWDFDGVTMSDWYAARSTDAAGTGGLDLVMPGPTGPWGDKLVEAVRAGRVDESAVDDKVLRILRLAARVGALDGVEAATAPARQWSDDEIAVELRRAAAAGFVLARNEPVGDGPLLPLSRDSLRCVAVIGPNAAEARTLGGGSATVFPPYTVAPLDGIRAALGEAVQVDHGIGVRSTERLPLVPPDHLTLPDGSGRGIEVRFLDRDGAVLFSETREHAGLLWLSSVAPGLPIDRVAAVEVHTRLHVDADGSYVVGASGVGPFRLELAGDVLLHTTLELPAGADPAEGMMRPPQAGKAVRLKAGEQVPLVMHHEPESGEFGEVDVASIRFQLNLAPEFDEAAELERAVALAAEADVAVVVVGTTEEVESEGFDRESLALPGRQDELVRRVVAANPRTVVVVNSGAPVLLPWATEVPAVLLSWFPGQEAGNALADVLLGASEPGGRLPVSWPAAEDGLPSPTPVEHVLPYDEGLFIGYRAYERDGRTPLFAFGSGSGYTTWDYTGVEVPAQVVAGKHTEVRVRLRNSGSRAGRDVVQVYLSRGDSEVERAPRWLAGFATVEAAAGADAEVVVSVPARAFQHWDAGAGGWTTEPGEFTVHGGSSLDSLPLRGSVTVTEG